MPNRHRRSRKGRRKRDAEEPKESVGIEEELGYGEEANFFYRGIDRAQDWQRGQLSQELHDRVAARIPKVGGVLPLIAVLGLFLVATFHEVSNESRYGPAFSFVEAAVSALICLGLGYVGYRFSAPCRGALDSNPLRISTRAYFDIIALLLTFPLVLLPLAAGGALVNVFRMDSMTVMDVCVVLVGFTTAAVLLYFLVTIFLHPELLKVEIDPDETSGYDFIGYASFGNKLILQSAVFIPSVLVVWGLASLAIGIKIPAFLEYGYSCLLIGLAYPMLAYFVHLILNLQLELLNNFLSIKSLQVQTIHPGTETSLEAAGSDELFSDLQSLDSEFSAEDPSEED